MKPESKLDILNRHIAEAEAAIARQKRLIEELEREGHPTKGSHILLGLFEETLRQAQVAAVTITKLKQGLENKLD